MISYIKRLYDWMGNRVYSPYADYILGFLFFLEAIFFLPTDPMLILYCINRQNRAMTYATIATFGSVLGGITGYWIGATLWHMAGEAIIHNRIINVVLTPNMFNYLSDQYQKYEWWAILVAGFTPVPYKAATLTAGFCKLSFGPFVLCSLIARGARFYLLAFIIQLFGDKIRESIDRYFNIIIGLTTIVIIATIWFLKI